MIDPLKSDTDFELVKDFIKGDGITQECRVCEKSLPQTADWFHRDSSTPSGFREVCKTCRKQKEDIARDKAIVQKVRELDLKTLEILSSPHSPKQTRIPHQAEMYEKLMIGFGGPEGFTQHFIANFLASKPGTAIREKMLRAILNLSKDVTQVGATSKDLKALSDDELEKEVEEAATIALQLHVIDPDAPQKESKRGQAG